MIILYAWIIFQFLFCVQIMEILALKRQRTIFQSNIHRAILTFTTKRRNRQISNVISLESKQTCHLIIIDLFHSFNFVIQNSRTQSNIHTQIENTYSNTYSTVYSFRMKFNSNHSNQIFQIHVSNLSALIHYRSRSRHKLPDTQYARTHANEDVQPVSKPGNTSSARSREECHITPFLRYPPAGGACEH